MTAARVDEDAQYEAGLRPRALDEYIGQDRIRENLQVAIAAAQAARRAARSRAAARPARPRQDDARLRDRATRWACRCARPRARRSRSRAISSASSPTSRPSEVLFIDEIHRMSPAIEEILYPALEDYEVDIVIGQGPSARTVKVPLERFTLIGATTRDRAADLAAAVALRHRPPARVLHAGGPRGDRPPLGADSRRADRRRRGRARSRGARAARRASPTGCCGASATTRRCAPTARSRSRSRTPALKLLEVDEHGFDEVDRKLLRTIIDKFGGGPVGLNTHRRGDQRREGRDRGHLRAVPDSDRLSRSHAARPRGDAARLRLFRARRARDEKGFTTVVTAAGQAHARSARRTADDDQRRWRPTCRRAC